MFRLQIVALLGIILYGRREISGPKLKDDPRVNDASPVRRIENSEDEIRG